MLDSTRAYGLDFLVPVTDDTVGASLRRHGEFARPELDLLLAYAQRDRGTFLDVGANLGAIALPFAKSRPGWQVHAIEAHRRMAGLLAANAYANHLYNVEPINAAAGAESGLIEFTAAPLDYKGNFGAFSLSTAGGHNETVRMLRLDDVASEDVRLIKIDVEGHERAVLAGAKSLLERPGVVWLVEGSDSNREATAQIVEAFIAGGYATYWFFAPFATPASEKARPENIGLGDMNILALPPGAENIWDLPAAAPGQPRPTAGKAYRYLARYGYDLPA